MFAKSFYIPSYQRGYRWREQQVKDLLEDIMAFAKKVENKEEKGSYYLQPIVLQPQSSNRWDVIDGQQRLTTIYIATKAEESNKRNTTNF